MKGRCRFCGCRDTHACAGGCSWTDRTSTVCTQCVDIERAWKRLQIRQLPNMTRAFGAGFRSMMTDKNPYRADSARYWTAGAAAGRPT